MARFTVSSQISRDAHVARLSSEGMHVKARPAPGGFEILWCVPADRRTRADEVLGSDRFFMNLPITHPLNATA